ncbi:NAD(P)-dependent oxidoreductase [Candidatus Nitrospira nitrificans]|uniref:Putative 3-hydroxyisobutyrate dehydrogenase n=1 Tax=Candidatus Nitrospira nitrificans TaxID=1742973 RepID=A0A0S4LLY3_9BACT|nr:NAD(P)-dependent oxidoreductase [Candidatus Nitrospira nitrificans]CUS37754.1 putative 3-hydroxyisobutyrate dehydrogenase [Candidatus Nitrospira nitrificans]
MADTEIRIGFVGVGRMGANMARRLKDGGYRVTAVQDRYAEASDSLARELNTEVAASPARVAEVSDIVITVVSDDAAMRDIYAEQDPTSLMAHAKDRLFINCATLSPALHIEIEQAVERRGGATLEACMASSITQARQGTLYLMCGGKQDVFDRARSVLDTLGTTVRYIGPAGKAATVKTLVNMVMNSNTAALAEGLGLGKSLGIDLTLLREVFSQTGAASRVLETDGEDMQLRAHDCYFSAAHAAKDSAIALGLAQRVGLSLPIAQATLSQYRRLIELGKGDLDKSAIAELTFPDRLD